MKKILRSRGRLEDRFKAQGLNPAQASKKAEIFLDRVKTEVDSYKAKWRPGKVIVDGRPTSLRKYDIMIKIAEAWHAAEQAQNQD